jgi:RNA polymerase sigma-70 factor, ECF subfamily
MSKRRIRSTTAPAPSQGFDEVVVPHLDAAYRLARWLTGNESDADDVVQEASLRALRYFETFSGGNARAWFLRIVRNTSYGWRSREAPTDTFDEEIHHAVRPASNPETLLLQTADAALVARVIRGLPARFRELLVLRELEGLSYRELADLLGIPIGSVMSGLSRARQAFRRGLGSAPAGSSMPAAAHLPGRPKSSEGVDGGDRMNATGPTERPDNRGEQNATCECTP